MRFQKQEMKGLEPENGRRSERSESRPFFQEKKMEYRKNDTVTADIIDLGQDGAGIGRTEDGYTLFIKDTVPGDRVEVLITKVKKSYGYGKLKQVLKASPDRVDPPCPVARQCGGCQLQMMSYPAQLAMKEEKVRNDLKRIGGFENLEIQAIVPMESPFRYRNKAQFPVGMDRDGNPITGFYAGRTHTIISNPDCLLGCPENREILNEILDWMKNSRIPAYNEETGKGLIRHILIRKGFATGEIIVCLIINGERIPARDELVARMRKIDGVTGLTYSSNTSRTNVILNGPVKPIWGQEYITDILESRAFGISVRYQISPASFYQINPVQTQRIYEKVLELADLHGNETVMDLYCGIGTISLFLARKAKKVIGVEIVPRAIEDARRNAQINGIENAEFYVGKAEEVVPELEQHGIRADVAVVDPPRKGCDEKLLQTLVRMKPERIVYVSCDPATLARDLKYLTENAFRVEYVQPYDQFSETVHVETVCLLSKLSETKSHISVKVEMYEMDLTAAESKATYQEIQDWVQEKYGFHVTHLNIAQVKRKYGIIERENYNMPKSEDSRQPGCPAEKIRAIEEALMFFRMI